MENQREIAVDQLNDIADVLDALCWKTQPDDVSEFDRLRMVEAHQRVIAGIFALSLAEGFSEVSGLAIYPTVARGEKLTHTEVIRQMVSGSRCNKSFADTLHLEAERIRKNPNVCGVEVFS